MGIFNKLDGKINNDDDDGINLVDLAEMPPNMRRLMRMMLREVEMAYEDICAWSQAQPVDQQMSKDELDAALADLTIERWLIMMGEERVHYEVNLRRKAGSTLASGIWSALDKRIQEQQDRRQDDEG